MKYFLISVILFFSSLVFSQVQSTSHVIKEKEQSNTTCVLSTVLYKDEDVAGLQKELISWDMKVINAIIDSQQKTITIIYNTDFNQIEFTEVLGKYNMSKKSIISCN